MLIEVPHFASLRGKEREIVILRSENGEQWKEHALDAREDDVHKALEGYKGDGELLCQQSCNTILNSELSFYQSFFFTSMFERIIKSYNFDILLYDKFLVYITIFNIGS